jgi:hypothetical protein
VWMSYGSRFPAKLQTIVRASGVTIQIRVLVEDSTNSFSPKEHLSMLDGSRIYRRLISPSFSRFVESTQCLTYSSCNSLSP